jgi:hypothetical protein
MIVYSLPFQHRAVGLAKLLIGKEHTIIDVTPMQFVRRAGSAELGWAGERRGEWRERGYRAGKKIFGIVPGSRVVVFQMKSASTRPKLA